MVQHVGVQGPFIKSKWSHIPITFSQEDPAQEFIPITMQWSYLVSPSSDLRHSEAFVFFVDRARYEKRSSTVNELLLGVFSSIESPQDKKTHSTR
jgi:hypothetical protein